MAKEEQIKTSIDLTGEKEYRAACSSINTSLREINSEMKLATAEFANNASSSEALTRKQEVLQKQLAEQAKKAEAAEAALRKMREAGIDPTDPAYQKMQTNLNNTKAEMAKTEQQINSTSKELKQSKVDWESVGNVVGKVGKAFGTALAALGTAAVGAASALAGLTVSASNYADDILTTSANTHIATDDLQKYSYALNFIDGDLNTLTGTMKKNTQIMSKARDGNKTYTAAYEKLGISITDTNGELRNGQEVYWEVIDALGKVENETERDALAMQLLGKSGTELNTIIDAGSEAFKDLGNEAEAMGYVMSDEAVSALGSFNDKLQQLKAGMTGLKNSAALIALPFLDDLASKGVPILAEFSKGIQEANGDVSKMGDVIGQGLADVVNLIVEKLPEFVEMGVTLVSSLIEGIVQNAPTIASAAVQIVETLVNGIATLLPMLIEGAAQLIVGLATGLGQSLPTLIPTIVEVVLQIVQTLIDNIPMLIDAALQLITGLAQGVINAIPVLVAALPQLITSLIDGLLSAIPQIIQAGIDLLVSLVAALPEIITAIVEAIPQIINGIVTALMENIPLIIQAGIDLLVALIQALPEIIVTIVQAIPQIISGIVNALIGNIDQIIMAGVQLFVALIENLPTIIIEIVKAVPQIVSGIVQAFASLGGELINAGANLLHGLWEGISSAASWLWDKVTGWASSLVDGIKGFFGIHSPSTVFAEIGTNMGEGVGVGFGESMDGVSSDMTAAMGGAGQLTAAEAVRSVNDGIIANIEGLSGAVNAIVERVITGLTAQAQKLNQAGQDFDKNIASGMIAAIPQITSKIPQIVQSIITAFTAQHQKFISEGENFDKKIAEGMVKGIPQITGKVSQIVQPVITALRSFISDFTAAGEDMVRGIWTGFQNMSGWLESRVRSMMRSIVAAVQSEMQINSPSKVFAGIGEFMAMGLGEGFAAEMRNVESTIRRETANAVPERDTGAGQRTDRRAAPTVEVVQNIYANETSYAKQQREAARQFRQIAREVMA
ncbi:phage tail protein [Neglectibacter caecimuris]|uniref:phage tail protein n=1 Tax=Neglectibacter caecimuris TaxID=3093658 RepID=UPI002AC96F21|nr:phage tail protein [Neglectibacter sp. M00184]